MSSMVSERESVLTEFKRGHLRELGLPTLFGAAVLFFSATMLLGVNISAMRGNLVWIEHAQKVLLQISALEAAVAGDEMTVRSYALTGDDRFILYQKLERDRAMRAIGELTRLTAMEDEHAERFAGIRRSIGKHMAIYGGLTGMGPDRAGVVAKAILDTDNRKIMMKTRAELSALRADEVREMGQRQQELTEQLSRAFILAVGIIIAAFVLGGIGLLATQIQLPFRHRS